MTFESTGDSRPFGITELHEICGGATAAEETALVGRLVGFAATAGGPAGGLIAAGLDVPRLHHWAAGGAGLSAVAALLGENMGYMLSRAPGGQAIATVVIHGLEGEFSCFGETEGIALCGAVSAALAAHVVVDAPARGVLLN